MSSNQAIVILIVCGGISFVFNAGLWITAMYHANDAKGWKKAYEAACQREKIVAKRADAAGKKLRQIMDAVSKIDHES